MLRALLLCSLAVFACGSQNTTQDGQISRSNVNTTEVVSKAAKWLMGQREKDFTWGTFTPRAIVALALAEEVHPVSEDDWNLMTKQINILLSLELGEDGGSKAMGLSRLALFINALYATCQDTRHFHGLDLVRELRGLTNAALAEPVRNFSLPVVFLPLCFSGQITHSDFVHLTRMYRDHEEKADLRAIELMAMACIARQGRFQNYESSFRSHFDSFTKRFPALSGNTDVYTNALGFQAMNAYKNNFVDPSSLVKYQESSGSFGSLLATYYAIPALLGKSLLDLGDRRCGKNHVAGRFEDSPFSESPSAPKVYYSLWIGEGVARNTHALTVPDITNKTFFDVMTMAQTRNPTFRFSYDKTDTGKRVYSLAGLPNDIEREIYWTLYLSKGGPNEPDPSRLHISNIVNAGVDRVHPSPEDHFVFWFRRGYNF